VQLVAVGGLAAFGWRPRRAKWVARRRGGGTMSRCVICLRDKPVRFKTSRLTICTRCVNLLNKTDLTPRVATERLRQELRANVVHKHGDNGGVDDWVSRKFPNFLDEWCKDPEKLGVPIKVIRAYRRQLLCLDRRFLDYPKDWRMRAYRHKHRDEYTCNVCGKRDESCRDLQAHHIIFRSRSGTNYAANIVVLCFDHHQAQHPDHVISVMGGEGPGFDQDDSSEGFTSEVETETFVPAPRSLWIPEVPTMPPRTKHEDLASLNHANELGRIADDNVDREKPDSIDATSARPVVATPVRSERSPIAPVESQRESQETSSSSDATIGWIVVAIVVLVLVALLSASS